MLKRILNYKYKTYIQQRQSDHNYNTYNINNKFIKSISNNKSIKRKEYFSLIKFLHKEILNI